VPSSGATNHLAGETTETREIDTAAVVSKTEPQRIFERPDKISGRRLAVAGGKSGDPGRDRTLNGRSGRSATMASHAPKRTLGLSENSWLLPASYSLPEDALFFP
jgi:hypothetical protein